MSSATQNLYQEMILEHNKNPRNFRAIENTQNQAKGHNPLCGDSYTVYMTIADDGIISDVSFTGTGCAISKASASLMTTALKGKKIDDAEKFIALFHDMVTGKSAPDSSLGKMVVLEGVKKYPARVKCAALSWHAARAAMNKTGIVSTE